MLVLNLCDNALLNALIWKAYNTLYVSTVDSIQHHCSSL